MFAIYLTMGKTQNKWNWKHIIIGFANNYNDLNVEKDAIKRLLKFRKIKDLKNQQKDSYILT